MNRRSFLRAASIAGAGALVAGCAPGRRTGNAVRPRLHLAPVDVSWERVIRTTVGLRPHRERGFRLEPERFDERLIVHNYGHGGSGMSLSWGTARIAAELAAGHADRKAAVIGAGIVGLTSARELQRRGFEVTVYAAALPPETTSNLSWAGFTPTSGLILSSERTPAWDAQFRRAAEIAYREHQLLVGRGYGVSWIDSFSLSDTPPGAGGGGGGGGSADPLLPAGIGTGAEVLGPGEHPFATRFASRRATMRFEPGPYLDALLRDLVLHGGRVEVRRFGGVGELLALPERVVVNATGLGAASLVGDEGMVPIKGQLTVLVPQPEVTWSLGGMLPRGDGIVLGHVNQRGVDTLEVDAEEQRRVIENAISTFSRMRRPPSGWVPGAVAELPEPPPLNAFSELRS